MEMSRTRWAKIGRRREPVGFASGAYSIRRPCPPSRPSALRHCAHPQPVHEALADLHGVTVSGADARLFVDAGRDEGRAALGECGVDQAVEILLVDGPCALARPAARASAT